MAPGVGMIVAPSVEITVKEGMMVVTRREALAAAVAGGADGTAVDSSGFELLADPTARKGPRAVDHGIRIGGDGDGHR